MTKTVTITCDFCEANTTEVDWMIASPINGVHICNSCIHDCTVMIERLVSNKVTPEDNGETPL